MKLSIKRSEWLRSEGRENSYLLRQSDNKKCCLGFLALALGADEQSILGKCTPTEVPELAWPGAMFNDQRPLRESYITGILMVTNDFEHDSEMVKERALTKQFLKLGIEVEFVD